MDPNILLREKEDFCKDSWLILIVLFTKNTHFHVYRNCIFRYRRDLYQLVRQKKIQGDTFYCTVVEQQVRNKLHIFDGNGHLYFVSQTFYRSRRYRFFQVGVIKCWLQREPIILLKFYTFLTRVPAMNYIRHSFSPQASFNS